MSEQVPDGDGAAEIRDLRQVLPDVVIERELALAGQQHDGGGVNCLATEPDSEIDSVESGTPYSRFDMPYALR